MKVIFSLFAMIALLPLEGGAAEMLKVDVSANSAILINADTGAILYEKNSAEKAQPASTIKVATALYTLDRHGDRLREVATASREAVSSVVTSVKRSGTHPSHRLESDGTHINLRVSEQMTIEQLLHGLLLRSGNDAANVIAEHLEGSIPEFVSGLNEYLKEIGVENTQVKNPHGLYDEGQLTTAYDLAMIAQRAIGHEKLLEILSNSNFERPKTNKQEAISLPQTNRLLKKGAHYYPKAFGIKTGYISAARNNLVAAAKDENRKLIAVVMGCPTSKDRFQDAIALFEKAFNEKKITRKLFSQEDEHFSLSIPGGATPLEAKLASDLSLTYYPSEQKDYKAYLSWYPGALPIPSGKAVGQIEVITEDGQLLCRTDLLSTAPVAMTTSYHLLHLLHTHLWRLLTALASLLLTILYLFFTREKQRAFSG